MHLWKCVLGVQRLHLYIKSRQSKLLTLNFLTKKQSKRTSQSTFSHDIQPRHTPCFNLQASFFNLSNMKLVVGIKDIKVTSTAINSFPKKFTPHNVLSFLWDLFCGCLSTSDFFFFKGKIFPSKNSNQMWISDFQIWECSDQEPLF